MPFEYSKPLSRKPRSERKVVQEVNTRGAIHEDESDSEIFRVKRRSSYKVEMKNARDLTSLNTDQQVLLHFMSGLFGYIFSIY